MTWLARLYVWATYRLYNEFAWAYDLASWLVSLGHWSGWRRSALDYVVGQQILEVGFGTGELLSDMARRHLNPVGLEISLAMHRIAGRKLARRGLQVQRVRGRVQALPFADGQFDSILSTFPAGYILQAQTLREFARLLCPPDPLTGTVGGRLVVVGLVVWADHPLWRWTMRFLFGPQDEPVSDPFERLAAAAGLRVQVIDQGNKGMHVPVIVAEKG